MRLGQPATKEGQIATNGFGEGTQLFEGGIPLPPLHAADVARRGVGFEREIFLGQPLGFARIANPFPEHLQGGRLFQRCQAVSWRDFPSSHYSGELALDFDLRSFHGACRLGSRLVQAGE